MPELVLIEWLDSHHVAGWHTDPPATKPVKCFSVGWLVHDGDDAKTIAGHWTQEDLPQRSGEMTIPACAIVKVTALK
jgi:hypothetical protein